MDEAQQRYSGGAILLHWLIALALAGQMALGFAMPKDASGFELYQLHKSIGVTILALSVLRLGWRWRMGGTRPPPAERGFTGWLASAVHAGFYVVMIALPLTGWALVSTAEIKVPTVLFGVVPLPHLPLPDGLGELFEESHELLAWGGIALFVLHVVGALRHQFLMKDRLLARMSPSGGGGFALLMGGVVVVLGLVVLMNVGSERAEQPAAPVAATPSSDLARIADGEAEGAEPESGATAEAEVVEDAPEAEAETEAEASAAAAGPPPAWTIRPGGTLRFSVDNAGSAMNGSFARWSGNIVMDPDNPQTARIAIDIDLASASMGDATQDTMLRGAEFLAAGSNPTATWRSTSVRSLGGGRYEAQGTLSLKGASRPQAIRFTLEGEGAQRQVTGSATIDRNAFGVGTGENAAGLGANVSVNFAFSASR